MKNVYKILLSGLILAFAFQLNAQNSPTQVVVKGYVKYANGTPAVNWPVTIRIDSAISIACVQVRTKHTNANGYYIDTVSCSVPFGYVRVSVPSCNGSVIVNNHAVPTNGLIESNFNLSCNPPTTTCNAYFVTSFSSSSNFVATFNSSQSAANNISDSIIKRTWYFGDGDSLTGNAVVVTHQYQSAGIYNVCLKIKSAGGCVDYTCSIIGVVNTCHAAFQFQPIPTSTAITGWGVKFNSNISTSISGSTIVERIWKWGDGTANLSGNQIDPSHYYAQAGIYNVCLIIKTSNGCIDTTCLNITVPLPSQAIHCKSKFVFQPIPPTNASGGWAVSFNSSSSQTLQGDSIRERIWKWGDGTANVTGNLINTSHVFAQAGIYNVCLIIRTVGGCSDTSCVSIQVPLPGQLVCKAKFTYTPTANSIKFNSNGSEAMINDTIISRKWEFGDGSTLLGNVVDPTKVYTNPGSYNVCLTIKTAKGCENKICKIVIATQVPSSCVPYFVHERIGLKKVRFNSEYSWTALNDSIIERKWEFGDGTTLFGNIINPIKEYNNLGVYTVCLKIRTASGCTNTICKPVNIQDSINITTGGINSPINIINTYPNPCTIQLNTVVWSQFNNIQAELAIYDIYGMKKWSTNKTLLQGNNYTVIPTAQLVSGPYFFKIKTIYGIKSRAFYKL